MARCSTRFRALERILSGFLLLLTHHLLRRFSECPCVGPQVLPFKSSPMHRRFLNGTDEILAANGDAFRPGRVRGDTCPGRWPHSSNAGNFLERFSDPSFLKCLDKLVGWSGRSADAGMILRHRVRLRSSANLNKVGESAGGGLTSLPRLARNWSRPWICMLTWL